MRKKANTEATGLGVAFLLSQLGWVASSRFTKSISDIGLIPAEAGLMRQLSLTPGITQQSLAGILKVVPSRMVVLIDSLEKKKLIERQNFTGDRRAYAISLTRAGELKLGELRKVMVKHESHFIAGLNRQEISSLTKICTKLRAAHGLSGTIHPAYKKFADRKSGK